MEETEDGSLAYVFSSDAAHIYTITFDISLYAGHLERFPFLLKDGFGLGLFPNETAVKKDENIAETVMDIIFDFLSNNPTSFLLYHCDYNDGKQKIRNRLFDIWHAKSNHVGAIYKYSLEVEIKMPDNQIVTHYIGFLCQKDNSNKANAIDEFEQFSVDLVGEGINKNNSF